MRRCRDEFMNLWVRLLRLFFSKEYMTCIQIDRTLHNKTNRKRKQIDFFFVKGQHRM